MERLNVEIHKRQDGQVGRYPEAEDFGISEFEKNLHVLDAIIRDTTVANILDPRVLPVCCLMMRLCHLPLRAAIGKVYVLQTSIWCS